MGQRNIYFPDEVEREIEKRAKKDKKSVSSLVVEMVQSQLHPRQFSKDFWKVIGSLSADFERPEQGDLKNDVLRESFEDET